MTERPGRTTGSVRRRSRRRARDRRWQPIEPLEPRLLLTVETTVDLVGGDIVVTDSNGGDTDDLLGFTTVGSDLLIFDSNFNQIDLIGPLDGGTGDEGTAVFIPLSIFPGGTIRIRTLAGDDFIVFDNLVLDADQRVDLDTGEGDDTMRTAGGIAVDGFGSVLSVAETTIIDGPITATDGPPPIPAGLTRVVLTTNSIDIDETVSAPSGLIRIEELTPGHSFGFSSIGHILLTEEELDCIVADTLEIGSPDAGSIRILDTTLDNVDTLILRTGASVTENAFIGSEDEIADLVVPNLAIEAANGVFIDTKVNNLDAFGGSGGVDIENTGPLVIGDVIGAVTGVSATGGDVLVTASGPITVNEDVVNAGSGAVTLTAGNALTGDELEFLQFVENESIDNDFFFVDVEVSPDGRHVYSTASGSIGVYGRDAGTGAIELVEIETGGISGDARDIAISPDGRHVYVTAGTDEDSVVIYDRDIFTGDLDLVATVQHGDGGVVELVSVNDVSVSPDGAHVYVGKGGGISIFDREPVTGALSWIGTGPAPGGRFLSLSPDGKHVYSIGNWNINAFSRNPLAGTLTFVETIYGGAPIDESFDVEVSPDGRHVYMVGYEMGFGTPDDSFVSVLQRNDVTGKLQFVEALSLEFGNIPLDVELSPSGDHVHVTGVPFFPGWTGATVYTRNATTGSLTFSESPAGGLSSAVSPDNGHVYILSSSLLRVYRRGLFDGTMTLDADVSVNGGSISFNAAGDILQNSGVVSSTANGDVSFNAATDGDGGGITMAPDTSVTSDTGNIVFDAFDTVTLESVASTSGDISVTGADVTLNQAISSSGNLALTPADSESTAGIGGGAGAFNLDDAEIANLVDGFSSIVIGSDAFGAGAVTVSGSLFTDPLTIQGGSIEVTELDAGSNPVILSASGGPITDGGDAGTDVTAASLVVTGNGVGTSTDAIETAVTALEGGGGIVGLYIDNAGALTIGGVSAALTGITATGILGDIVVTASSPITVIEDIVHSGGGDVVLTASPTLGPGSGALTFVQSKVDETGDVIDGLDQVEDLLVSPDGKHLYAVARGDDAITVFERVGSTGALTFVQVVTDLDAGVDGLDIARGVAIEPLGNHVYVASTSDDAVAVFSRDFGSGLLTFVEAIKDATVSFSGLNGARDVAVSPDGANVYVTSTVDHALVSFSRDAGTGALTHIGTLADADAGVDGLEGAFGVTLSPDGNHVYVAAVDDRSVAVFDREIDGSLTFVEVIKDLQVIDSVTIDGLAGAQGVAVSSDGGHVYVSAPSDNAVSVFERNSLDGTLTYVEVNKQGAGGIIDGMGGARNVAVSPDASNVYVASTFSGISGTVAVFGRESDGTLTFVEAEKDEVGDADELLGAFGVTVSPDANHVYVAAALDDAITVFARETVAVGSPADTLTIGANVTTIGPGTISLTAAGDILQTSGAISAQIGSVSLAAGTTTLESAITMSAGTSIVSPGGPITFDATGVITLDDVTSTFGNITVTSSDVVLNDTVAGGGVLTLQPAHDGATIGLGGGAGTFDVGDSDLANLADGFTTITIGNATAGDIDVDTAAFGDPLDLVTAGALRDGLGTDLQMIEDDIATVLGTVAPGQSPGILLVDGSFTFGPGTYEVEIGGLAPGATSDKHDQVDVDGAVSIVGAALSVSSFGGYVPSGDATFTIVDNDGADPVSGIFLGLPEGATVSTDFLGSGQAATISYIGGDGNDVVITTGTTVSIDETIFSGASGDVTISVDGGGDLEITDTSTGLPITTSVPLAGVALISVKAQDGSDDTLTVDLSGGNLIPAAGLVYDGGSGGNDGLVVTGGAFQTVTFSYGGPMDGTIALDPGGMGTPSTISYADLEPISVGSATHDAVFNLTAGADVATLFASGGALVLDSPNNAFETTTFAVPSDSITVNGETDDDTLMLSDLSAFAFVGDVVFNGGDGGDTYVLEGGTLDGINGAAGTATLETGDVLRGSGTIDYAIDVSAGTIAPGLSPGLIHVHGLTLTSDSTTVIDIDGVTTPGTDFDRIDVTGAVVLDGTLDLAGSTVVPVPGQSVVIISNDSMDAVSGTFSGLPNGSPVTVAGATWTIRYDGGDGNDVALAVAAADVLYVDDDWNGTTSGADPDGAGPAVAFGWDAFATIQEAVDAVADNGTISILNGTYTETIVIEDKGMTITGESEVGVIVQAIDEATSMATGPSSSNVFSIDPGNDGSASGKAILIERMTIRHGNYGIRSRSGDVSVMNATVTHNGWNGLGLPDVGAGATQNDFATFWSGGNGPNVSDGGGIRIKNASNITLHGNTVIENRRGLRIQDSDAVVVTDNHSERNLDAGIYFISSGPGVTNGRISGNVSRGNLNNGILIIGGHANEVDDNTVEDNFNSGVMLYGPSELILRENSIRRNNLQPFNGIGNLGDALGGVFLHDLGPGGTIPGSFTAQITDNTIQDNEHGRSIQADAIFIDIANGTEAATARDAILVSGNVLSGHDIGVRLVGQAANLTLTNNSITDADGVQNGDGAGTVDASGNWWGDQDPSVVAGLNDQTVDFTPWLDTGTDVDGGTIGFQGDFSVLNVDDAGSQTGASGRITEGIARIDGVPAIGVKVHGGTFTESVVVDKAIWLTGEATISGSVALSMIDATLSPGFSPGVITGGDLDFDAGTRLGIELDGPGGPGVGHDQVVVSGTVTIDSTAVLDLALGHVPAIGTMFVIVDNDGGDAIVGEFNNLADGSTVTLAVGDGSVPFLVDYQGGDGNDITLTALSGPTLQVVEVLARGSTWSQAFLDRLENEQLGTGGFRIESGSAAQLDPLPWPTVDTFLVRFNREAIIDPAAVALAGASAGTYATSVGYDPATFTATITSVGGPIGLDALTLSLADTIEEQRGNALDGEWIDGVSEQSGDGHPGGAFAVAINVLPGDMDRSGTVGTADLQVVLSRFTQSVPIGDFARADIAGAGGPDGVVGTADLQVVLARFTNTIVGLARADVLDAASRTAASAAAPARTFDRLDGWAGWKQPVHRQSDRMDDLIDRLAAGIGDGESCGIASLV